MKFYEQADKIQGLGQQAQKRAYDRPKTSLSGKRPVSGLSVGPKQFFQEFTKYTQFSAQGKSPLLLFSALSAASSSPQKPLALIAGL